jgi:hypothetical protein
MIVIETSYKILGMELGGVFSNFSGNASGKVTKDGNYGGHGCPEVKIAGTGFQESTSSNGNQEVENSVGNVYKKQGTRIFKEIAGTINSPNSGKHGFCKMCISFVSQANFVNVTEQGV